MKWPRGLVMIRHGQSEFNTFRDRKEQDPEYQKFMKIYQEGVANGFQFPEETIALTLRLIKRYELPHSDHGTPLTTEGFNQALATGKALEDDIRIARGIPDVIYVSPYLRTRQTLQGLQEGCPALDGVPIVIDERIREKSVGLKELYNDWRFMNVIHPEQGRLHDKAGRYYFCEPQGEGIVDVQLRSRQWFQTLTREYPGSLAWVITHHLTILSIMSRLERWAPEQFVEIDANSPPRNCSLTSYGCLVNKRHPDGKLRLYQYDEVLY
ncbi:MAG: histidine phosphatase family protein [bacterium]|nr:histidine phosphatase family protein [bacterium]